MGSRRIFVALAFLVFTAAGSAMAIADEKKPNVLIILADDSGFSDIGCYGGEIETPNLDSLASGGLQFTQFYNTGRCWPTRAALMTGYYAQQVHRDSLPTIKGGNRGVRQKWARLMPDFLKPHGYRNYHSGKWHLDGRVLTTGFDRSLNMQNQGNFFSAKGNQIDDKPIEIPADESGYYATTATADHAIECLKEHADKYSDQPFMHYLAFIAPHFPLHAPPSDIAKYRDKYLAGWEAMRYARFAKQQELGIHATTLSELETEVGPPYHFQDALDKLGDGEVNRPVVWDKLTDKQKRFQATKMAIHAAMIDRMDQEIGRVIDQLKAMGEFENTIIFFASDNGASAEIMVRNGGHDPDAPMGSEATYLCLGPGFSSACNTPYRRHKTWVHEGGISTPLIVHWPKGIKTAGELRTSPAHMVDIMPTVLEAIGVEKPADWKGEPIPEAPGRSLFAAFDSDIVVERDFLWWLHEGNRALRVGDLKLVSANGGDWELYDMKTDRAESNNLIKKYPQKAKTLEAIWNKQLESTTALVTKTLDQQPKLKRRKKKSKK
ncbi:MAG: arylsulfatase [Mariniblastus sp.]